MMVKQEEHVQHAARTGQENTYQNIEVKEQERLWDLAQAEGQYYNISNRLCRN